jgi:hypothetical protein
MFRRGGNPVRVTWALGRARDLRCIANCKLAIANCKLIGVGILVVLGLATLCQGQVHLQVHRGWGENERAGRWNPVLVRVSSPVPREVTLEIVSATEAGFGTSIRERVAIGPNAATFELFAPSHYSPAGQSVVVIRDAETDRTIAQFPEQVEKAAKSPSELGPGGVLIGVSGQPTQLEAVSRSGVAAAGYLPARLLPRAAIGYDAIDVLYLNQPKLAEIEPEQKRAILDWVRAGGSLLYSPDQAKVPADDPVIAALPCGIGDPAAIHVNADALAKAGIPARFAHVAGRVLSARAGARPLELIPGGQVTAYSGRFGLGRVVVSPIDLAAIEFDPNDAWRKAGVFWRPIVNELVGGPPPEPKRQYAAPYYGLESESEDQEREGGAVGTLCDFVTAPVASPWTIPLVVLGILFVIGPVDSVVLFATGRRPWAWTTSPAWLALIAGGVAFGIAHLRPATFDCRAVRVVDQAEDGTVATTDLIGISSSGDGRYSLDIPGNAPVGWWQPAIPGLAKGEDIPPEPNLQFHGSDAAVAPEAIRTDPELPRFLRSDRIAPAPPVVEALLSLASPNEKPRLVGTIRNASNRPLKELRVRTRFGVIVVPLKADGTLGPGETVQVDVAAQGEPFAPAKAEGQYQSYGYFGSRHLQSGVREADLWSVAPDLSGRRTLHVDQLINAGDDFACVYAETVDPAPVVSVNDGGPKAGQTFQWIRALVPLKR